MGDDDSDMTLPPNRTFGAPQEEGSPLSGGAISIIVIGVLALLTVIAVVCYVLFCRRERHGTEAAQPKYESELKKSGVLPPPPHPPMEFTTVYHTQIFCPAPQYFVMIAPQPGQAFTSFQAQGGTAPKSGLQSGHTLPLPAESPIASKTSDRDTIQGSQQIRDKVSRPSINPMQSIAKSSGPPPSSINVAPSPAQQKAAQQLSKIPVTGSVSAQLLDESSQKSTLAADNDAKIVWTRPLQL